MYKKYIKRILDFVIALLATPVVLLVIAIMAPIIYLDDRGPVFYNALRRGRNGKSFKMYKLRSMYINSPDIKNLDGSTYNGENDPRVTRVGRFMRKTSIDEIPQILNVLFGDMSFIGPRPTLMITPYEQLNYWGQKRLQVRPGISGYAQAYYRNSITQDEKFRCDCEYVDKVSFILDVRILFKTLFSVIKRENIYVNENSNIMNEGNKK